MQSVNRLAQPLLENMLKNADELGIAIESLANGTRVIDAGINSPGGLEAGRIIAEICLGGLGQVILQPATKYPHSDWQVEVKSDDPIIGCLASQYAGWSLQHGDGKGKFSALGSGPGRAIGSKEPLFDELNYRDKAPHACLVLEVDQMPPLDLADKIAQQCNIDASALTLILTPTTSESGVVQIVARVLETALHKAHALKFPLHKIKAGTGSAPLCPVADDFMTGMGRTNDAILFAGEVTLSIDAPDDEIAKLANSLPSTTSADYGKKFIEIFKAVNYDFYQIDPMLFSPASVTLTSLQSGQIFSGGYINTDLLAASFSE